MRKFFLMQIKHSDAKLKFIKLKFTKKYDNHKANILVLYCLYYSNYSYVRLNITLIFVVETQKENISYL